MKHYFMFAGEASGDLHGSLLIQALKEKGLNLAFSGVGGPKMRQAGLDCFLQMENFQVMGFSDVLLSLPRLCKLFYAIRNHVIKLNPDCVILIDYPGFNLRLAKALRKHGYKGKLIQYICPSIWAHGKNRIFTLEKYFDLVLSIFPFEPAYFSQNAIAVKYIGNPLVEKIQKHDYRANWKTSLGIPSEKELIALFPGSRLGEIKQHVPQQLEVASALKRSYPHLCFVISLAQDHFKSDLSNLIKQNSLKLNEDFFVVPPDYSYELMQDCQTALAKSGTVTLELALHETPTVVHYELSFLNYLFAKYVLRLHLPHYCIVNLLGKKFIFPELIGKKINLNELTKNLERLHFDQHIRKQVIAGCKEIKDYLSHNPSYHSAAEAIQELV